MVQFQPQPFFEPTLAYVHGDLDDSARWAIIETLQQAHQESDLDRRRAILEALDLLIGCLRETVHPGTLILVRGGARPFVRKLLQEPPSAVARLEVLEHDQHVLPLATPTPVARRG